MKKYKASVCQMNLLGVAHTSYMNQTINAIWYTLSMSFDACMQSNFKMQ